jgi:hypothetical protein
MKKDIISKYSKLTIPSKIKKETGINKWDIVQNISASISKGAFYVVIGYLEDCYYCHQHPNNSDGSKEGFIVLRLYGLEVETMFYKDLVKKTGINFHDIIKQL